MPFSFLKRNRTSQASTRFPPFAVDMHAHILPLLDNGPQSLEESVALIQEMASQGLRKIIATPHIMGEFYENSIENIRNSRNRLRSELIRKCISIEIDMAAEYYLDVSLVHMLEQGQPLLAIQDTYLLLETSIVGRPSFLYEAIELIQKRGLVPVLAHPERYHYLQQNFDLVIDLHRRGVLFQLNLNSWQSNHLATRQLAERLTTEGLVSFVGSNTHNQREWSHIKDSIHSTVFARLVEKGLLNSHLL